MARRGENIYKRKDGRWEGRILNGFNIKGYKKYKSFYGKSYKEVKEKMKEALTDDTPKKVSRKLLMSEALSLWLSDNRLSWKESTYACYMQIVKRQILPELGGITVFEFNTVEFNRFVLKKKQTKLTECNEPLSDTYIKSICCVLLQSLRYLQKKYHYELIIPTLSQSSSIVEEQHFPEEHELYVLEKYLTENAQDNTNLGILLCFYTGIRIGELCALQWKDIDFEIGTLKIRKTLQRVKQFDYDVTSTKVIITAPKTKQSIREIPIPKIVLNLLYQYKAGPETFIIRGKKTPYVETRTLQYRFERILVKCNIKAFNFHKLRHIFATKCIIAGFDVNSLSELLGHSSIHITLKLYVHSTMERKKSLMEVLQLTVA